MWDWLSIFPYLAIVALVAFFFILIISVSLLEKQRIRQLEAVPRDSLVPTSSYFDAMNEAAAAHGYTSCGAYARIPRNAFTNAYMAAWLSPDRTTLACVMGGKVAKANYRKTLLVSWIEEEKFLVTRDDFGETDPSKILEIEVVLNADFSELSTRHAQRLAGSHARPKLLDPVSVTMYWERMEEIRAKKLISYGRARFVDEADGIWRYNFRGAWMNFMDVVKTIRASKGQSGRLKIKRPGS
ncbi:MAG: hypothetical protein DME18_15845 [Verrucomicrobia bacterium]|nr:MAG: hypothetical protein DME18_15845 [Verrucomicrobiota bacterium]